MSLEDFELRKDKCFRFNRKYYEKERRKELEQEQQKRWEEEDKKEMEKLNE